MKKTILLSLIALLAAAGVANGRTITVRLDGTGDYTTIQDAIDDCNDGDEVVVADGTYTGVGNRDIDFLGKPITVRSENGPENCIIDCNGTESDPHCGFYFHSGEDANSVLTGFTITNGNTWGGGAIYCDPGSPTIINCTITSNTAGIGGGIGSWESSPTIVNCTISGNSAEATAGISLWRGSPVITNCTISGNSAEFGAVIFCLHSNPTITNCTITNNSNMYEGGGIFCRDSVPTITNCTIAGNSAEWGGGIYCRDSIPTITNCTITSNMAETGGGIFCLNSILTITNCILWGDSPDEIYVYSGLPPEVTFSNIQGGWPGQSNIDEDPCFAFSTDCHLMPSSPCIDAGDPNYIAGPNETDLDGNPRILDGNGDANAVTDMGAYEYNPDSPSIAVSSVSFSYTQDELKPASQTMNIRNCGTGTLCWEIVEDCDWLDVWPTNGISTGQINEVTITVDPNGLMSGHYTCILRVLDPNAANSPVIVQVPLYVGAILRVPENFLTIQAAINAAFDYDVVLVADDTYTGHGNRNLDFNGKAIIVRSENGPNDCIIDCQNVARAFYFNRGEGADSVVKGFTLTNGDASHGGAIYCEQSSPTITNCTITGNSAEWGGGGILCYESSPTISNCTISNNTGGGIYYRGASNPKINNCTITSNSAEWGGGISCGESSLTITNSTITDNVANGWGGGGILCMYDSPPTITNCTISGNSAGHSGGGIVCSVNSPPTITNCTISGNWAGFSGGGIECGGDSPMITHSTISGNSAGVIGGGFFAWGSSPTITNCTISGNSAGWGGGMYNRDSSSPTINNCTFAGNSATDGNAIACDSWDNPSNVQVTNCILADGGNEIWNNDDSTITITYSDVQDGWPGQGNTNADPWFVELGYWDMNDFWVDGDYHLLKDSPCIDAGDPNYIPEPNETDLDGNPRIVNGIIDMGAYEAALLGPVELLANLTQDVIVLNLHRGIANSLLAKLDTALQKLEDANEKNDVAAINSLQAFINAVEAQRSKKIPGADADALIATALEIIDLLSAE